MTQWSIGNGLKRKKSIERRRWSSALPKLSIRMDQIWTHLGIQALEWLVWSVLLTIHRLNYRSVRCSLALLNLSYCGWSSFHWRAPPPLSKEKQTAMPIDLKRFNLPDGFFRFLSFKTISSSKESN